MMTGLLLALAVTIVPRGDADMTAELMGAVDKVRAAGGGEIRLEDGDYHFRSPQAMRFYVSNHDNPMPRNVFLPITNVTDLTIVCDGRAEFIFHGEGIGVGFMDTRNVKMRGVGVDWDRPYFNEVDVEEVGKDGRIVISADPRQFPLELDENGRLISVGEGWKKDPRILEFWDGEKLSRIGGTGFDGKAEALGGNRFRIRRVIPQAGFIRPLRKGDYATMRSPWRPSPAVHLYRAHDTLIEDCVIRASAGMGLIAQRCENVTVRGTGKPLDKRAGAFARPCTGRRLSLQADATHFSNCKGLVTVENCLFEGMNDDAINVHSTCLRIERVDSPTRILCGYKHNQSVGFEVFLPGENVRAIKARTMEPVEKFVKVVSAEMVAPDRVLLTLDASLPGGCTVGDAVENADWQPAVVFRGNHVRNSSPRATLFTTPGKIVCEDNIFEHISAQAIHMSADTWFWYESGGCRDVLIRNNVFRNVCILRGKGVVQIDPNVQDLPAQKARYHRNVVIEGNLFEQDKGPLLFARSVSNLVWRANKVVGKADGFDVKFCDDIKGVQAAPVAAIDLSDAAVRRRMPALKRPTFLGSHYPIVDITVKGEPLRKLILKYPLVAGYVHGHVHTASSHWTGDKKRFVRTLCLPSASMDTDLGYVVFRTSPGEATAKLVMYDFLFPILGRKEPRPEGWDEIVRDKNGRTCTFVLPG